MSKRDDSRSPSPDEQVGVTSYRSSRAGSEVPSHRPRDSMAATPRSHRSSRCSSYAASEAAATHAFEGISAISSPTGTPRRGDVGGNRSARDYANGKRVKQKQPPQSVTMVGNRVKNAWGLQQAGGWASEAGEMVDALYHTIANTDGSFRFFQQMSYPFESPDAPTNQHGPSSSPLVDGDSAEYEAMGDLHPSNTVEVGSTRSVVRQDSENVESCVSAMSLTMLPDPLHGRPVMAICIGDANGRVNYFELGVGSSKRNPVSFSVSRPSISNLSTTSRSQTEPDLASFTASTQSERSFSDVLGFQKAPLRRHSHQAYVREMDCLTSVTILQSVKTLRFLRSHESPSIVSYLTSNERVIKLFRVPRDGFSPFHVFPAMESVVGRRLAYTRYFPRSSPPSLTLPVRVFAGCHVNPVQDLSICADGRTFLTMDDLQVFWWDLEGADTSKGVCITDCQPPSGRMDDVEELITAASFHPSHSSLFLVSRSSGLLGIGDLRDPPSRGQRRYNTNMRISRNPSYNEQCSDILCSISDANFLGSNHVITRDYLSLKLWDLRRPDVVYSTVPVMEYVAPYLNNLYESDAIFDRFPLAVDHTSNTVITGLYDGAVAVWQPLSEGKIDAANVMTYYRTDPMALPCEVENGGRVTVDALEKSLENAWNTAAMGMSPGDLTPDEVPEVFSNKVLCLSIADGGERFAFTCQEGRCVSIFERKPSPSTKDELKS